METIRKAEPTAHPIYSTEIIPFVSLVELEKTRRQLFAAGFQTDRFSDRELIIVLQQQKRASSEAILPFLLNWLLEKYYIQLNGKTIKKNPERINDLTYQKVGEIDRDIRGKYYLMAASAPEKKLAGLYKLYTDGKISEMRISHN